MDIDEASATFSFYIDPFDVAICLEQIEWGRHNSPAKSLFTITTCKR